MDDETKRRLAAANTNALVAKYRELRDTVKNIEAEAEEKAKGHKAAMMLIEAALLDRMNANSEDAIKTPAGTAYRHTHWSASVSDPEAFWDYAKKRDAPEIYQARASVSEIRARADVGDMPPGVTLSSYDTIRIRKGS